jgi:hypothetical protein
MSDLMMPSRLTDTTRALSLADLGGGSGGFTRDRRYGGAPCAERKAIPTVAARRPSAVGAAAQGVTWRALTADGDGPAGVIAGPPIGGLATRPADDRYSQPMVGMRRPVAATDGSMKSGVYDGE